MRDESKSAGLGPAAIEPRWRVVLYVGAWLLALYLADPTWKLWEAAWAFPLGLSVWIFSPDEHPGLWFFWAIFAACCAVYLIHGIFFFRSRQPALTTLLYAALILLLLYNVAGCRHLNHAPVVSP